MMKMKRWLALPLALGLMLPTSVALAADSPLDIQQFYMILQPKEAGKVTFMNMVTYQNEKAEEYKGTTDGGVIHVTLPDGAKDLKYLDPQITIVNEAKGFHTITPIPANKAVIAPYSFDMAGLTEQKAVEVPVDTHAQQFLALIPKGQGTLKISGADAKESNLNFNGQDYTSYTIENVAAGTKVKFNFVPGTGAPASTAPSKQAAGANANQASGAAVTGKLPSPPYHPDALVRAWFTGPLKSLNPHVFIACVVILLAAGIYLFRMSRRKPAEALEMVELSDEDQTFLQLAAKRKAILDKMVELEQARENQQVTEEEFQAKKESYKQLLIQVKIGLQPYVE